MQEVRATQGAVAGAIVEMEEMQRIVGNNPGRVPQEGLSKADLP